MSEKELAKASDKNINNLLKILGSKKATEALKELGKTDWSSMKDSVDGLNEFVSGGGIAQIIEGFKETMDLQIESALSPLTNQVNQYIIEALNPLKETLNDIFNDLASFTADYKSGALAGGITGAVIAQFLPGGAIVASLLTALGSLIGAGIEAWLTSLKQTDIEEIIRDGAEKFGGKIGDKLDAIVLILDENRQGRDLDRPADVFDADYIMDKLAQKFDLGDWF